MLVIGDETRLEVDQVTEASRLVRDAGLDPDDFVLDVFETGAGLLRVRVQYLPTLRSRILSTDPEGDWPSELHGLLAKGRFGI